MKERLKSFSSYLPLFCFFKQDEEESLYAHRGVSALHFHDLDSLLELFELIHFEQLCVDVFKDSFFALTLSDVLQSSLQLLLPGLERRGKKDLGAFSSGKLDLRRVSFVFNSFEC